MTALGEVMGGPLSTEQQKRLWNFLGIVLKAHIVTSFNFKEFSGIAAFVERVFACEFDVSAAAANRAADYNRRSEIEIADFDRLASKVGTVQIASKELKEILDLIKESG